ncbi:hypothetical protein L2E82_29578 [Cichorium intybus]|uniref:Uncharacterized protein n=1 Tax=Cichorium intybus TaxID=13427 RepID=A0ACB9CY56_CICIN|nr:hypothetical protein L2E82_29578 [Cichorium intybus]
MGATMDHRSQIHSFQSNKSLFSNSKGTSNSQNQITPAWDSPKLCRLIPGEYQKQWLDYGAVDIILVLWTDIIFGIWRLRYN